MTYQKWFKFCIITILGTTLPIGLASMLAWPGNQTLAQAPITPTPIVHHESGGIFLMNRLSSTNEGDLAAAAAAVDRTSVAIYEDYHPLLTITVTVLEIYTGTMPTPFTYNLSGIPSETLSDVAFSEEGSGSCIQESDNDIRCDGEITEFFLTFRFYFTPSTTGGNLILGAGGSSSFTRDHTVDLFYPDPLELIGISDSDKLIVNSGNQLRWQEIDAQGSFVPRALFRDPRIRLVYLPLVLK